MDVSLWCFYATPAQAPKGRGIPAQGATLGTGWKFAMRSEGTPHRPVADGLCGDMRRSFRTRKWPGCFSQGVALRWYAVPRWGKNSMPQRGKDVVSNKFPIWMFPSGASMLLQRKFDVGKLFLAISLPSVITLK